MSADYNVHIEVLENVYLHNLADKIWTGLLFCFDYYCQHQTHIYKIIIQKNKLEKKFCAAL
jgi:hypothetical protein